MGVSLPDGVPWLCPLCGAAGAFADTVSYPDETWLDLAICERGHGWARGSAEGAEPDTWSLLGGGDVYVQEAIRQARQEAGAQAEADS